MKSAAGRTLVGMTEDHPGSMGSGGSRGSGGSVQRFKGSSGFGSEVQGSANRDSLLNRVKL
jgi:hypothetical protein